jgi:hypothetical protein
MKALTILGALMIALSGYLTRIFTTGDLQLYPRLFLGGLIFIFFALGLAAIYSNDAKSFKKHVINILNGAWPF